MTMSLFATGVLVFFAAIEFCIAVWKLMRCGCVGCMIRFIGDILFARALMEAKA